VRKVIDTYRIVQPARTLPVSVADAKTHLRVTGSDHDDLISDLIYGAAKQFEKRANVCLSTQRWRAFCEKGYSEIELWKYPITSIDLIQYYNTSNAITTLSSADYFSNVDSGSNGYIARPVLLVVEDVPSTYQRDDAFIITFTAGYTSIDHDVKQALLSWVYRKYENPNDAVTERISFFDNVVGDNRSYGL
jgi:uncharacterized phiE125 gp8 family phage protein